MTGTASSAATRPVTCTAASLTSSARLYTIGTRSRVIMLRVPPSGARSPLLPHRFDAIRRQFKRLRCGRWLARIDAAPALPENSAIGARHPEQVACAAVVGGTRGDE